MTKLLIKLNNEVVDHVELKQGDMKIGRKPGCEIVLDNLAVSGEHANIFTIGEDSFIQDLNSTNGTFINNKRMTKHHLRNGDIVRIGQHALIYMRESARPVKSESDDDVANTVVINTGTSSGSKPAPPASPASDNPAGANDRPVATLFILNEKTGSRRIELKKTVTNLGKTGRPGGIITRTADGYVLRAAANGDKPKLNGRTVTGDGMKLRNGDVIEVAGTRLQFYVK